MLTQPENLAVLADLLGCWIDAVHDKRPLIKTGARLVHHGRYAIFQMAEAALPREVFVGILNLINGLRGPPSCEVPA